MLSNRCRSTVCCTLQYILHCYRLFLIKFLHCIAVWIGYGRECLDIDRISTSCFNTSELISSICRWTVSLLRGTARKIKKAFCCNTVSIISFKAGNTRSSPIVCGFAVFAISLDIFYEAIRPYSCRLSVCLKRDQIVVCFASSFRNLEVTASFVWMHSVEVVLESTLLHCLVREDRATHKAHWTGSVMWSCCETKFLISAVIWTHFHFLDLNFSRLSWWTYFQEL